MNKLLLPEQFLSQLQRITSTDLDAEVARRDAERTRKAAIEDDRDACKSLSQFIQRAWHVIEPGTVYRHNWHIDALAEHLQAVHSGQIRRLIINVPPGSSKSTVCGVFFPMWSWGPGGSPTRRFLGVAHEQTLGVRDNLKCRRLVQSDWYQERWPIAIASDQNEKLNFENMATGFRSVATPSNITGRRADVVIVDDPLSVEAANSVVEREKVNLWFSEALPTRLNDPERSAIVLVMQRLHEDDPTGMILSKNWGWDHLLIPNEYEPDRKSVTSICWIDPRKVTGELFFPTRFPPSVVEEYRRTLGPFAYAGQFQQRPVPREGAMFKRQWMVPLKAVPPGTRWVRYWDLAATEAQFGADPDYTVGLKLGRMQDGRYVIADVNRLRAEGTGVRRMIKDTARSDGRFCEIGLPQDPGQAGKVQAQDLVAMLSGFIVRAIRETGDKMTRAEPIAAQAEAGNLCYLEGEEWVENFMSEVTTFPGGKFKDQVDALSGAFSMLMRSNMFGIDEEMIALDPSRIVKMWGRVAAIDVAPTHVSIVFAAFNQTADTMIVYDSLTGPRQDLAIYAAAIRAKHPEGSPPQWIPVLLAQRDHGRSEDEGERMAQSIARMGVEVMVADYDIEAGVDQVAERLNSRRLRVFDDQVDWFTQYRRFARDEKGEIPRDENGLMRATALIAIHGKDMAITERRATSDTEDAGQARSSGRRSAAGY